MKMLEEENVEALFSPNPVYTKIRDDNPTRYAIGSRAKNVMAADGCVIEGEVENSVLFRGVKVGKGAKVRNCVLMQDTVIETGATDRVCDYRQKCECIRLQRIKRNRILPGFCGKRKNGIRFFAFDNNMK